MTWLFILLTMTLVALVAGIVTGRITGSMEPPVSSLPFRGLPSDDVAPTDLEELRFDAALRGYRMDQVDEVLDRLVGELRRRDEEIAALREDLADARRRSVRETADPSGRYPGHRPALRRAGVDDEPAGEPGHHPPDGSAKTPSAVDTCCDPAYAPPSSGLQLRDWPDEGHGGSA